MLVRFKLVIQETLGTMWEYTLDVARVHHKAPCSNLSSGSNQEPWGREVATYSTVPPEPVLLWTELREADFSFSSLVWTVIAFCTGNGYGVIGFCRK